MHSTNLLSLLINRLLPPDMKPRRPQPVCYLIYWRSVVVNMMVSINTRPYYYLDGWPSADRYATSVCTQLPRSTQCSIPPR